MSGRVRIGISGWRYPRWRGSFYPAKLPQREELHYAAGIFDSVEINGTFYSLQRPTSFHAWSDQTPDDFLFALKGGRYITHMLKLRNVEKAVANYFASGVLTLGQKLGPILWQLPPQLHWDPDRFDAFFRLLPRSATAAARLARASNTLAPARSEIPARARHSIRHCVEVRHESFAVPAFLEMLRRHRIGLVVADTVEWPLLLDVTADFVYVRLHGSEQLYASGYSGDALDLWAQRIVRWAQGHTPDDHHGRAHRLSSKSAPVKPRDVFVYFDNDAKVHAPFDAQELRKRVDRLLGGGSHQAA